MRDGDKDKEQLQNELMKLRKKVDEIEHEKARQKQTEKKLAKSKEMYRLIAENSADVITLHKFNLKAIFTYISPSCKDIGGYKPEELLGKSPFEFIHPDDKKKLFPVLKDYIDAKLKKFFTGKELPANVRLEFRFKDKEGNWRYFQSTVKAVGNQLLFITRDVTEQKKIEETLHLKQQEFASLFRCSPEALVYTDEKSDILDINPRFTELFGYTLEEIKGRNIDDGMLHPPVKIDERKELSRIAQSVGYFKYETIRKKKDGTLFPVSISGSNITIDGQLKGMLAIYIDTTEWKNILDKLKESEEKYRHLFDNMPGAYYRIDREGNLVMINPEGAKLLGYNSSKDILGKDVSQHFYFAPKERKKYFKELKKNKGNLGDFEIILKREDGSALVISDTSHFYYDKDGNIAGVEGIFVDITERKKAEEKLRQSEEKFAGIFKNIPEAAFYRNTKGIILDVNPHFTRLFGYAKKEILGKNIDEIGFYPKDKLKEGEDLTRKTLNEDLANFETIRQKKDGTPVPVRISTSFVKIKDKVSGTLALYQNITERKQSEKIQKVLYSISKAANSPISLNQLYKTIHKELGTIIRVCAIFSVKVD